MTTELDEIAASKLLMTNDQFDLKQRTRSFAVRIIKMYCALPKRSEAQVLGKQLLRSGNSVGANYAEDDSARSRPEFIAKTRATKN